MGGSTTTQDTQQQQVTQLPPWINDAAQQNYGFAQNVAARPLQQYQGQMVPDVSDQMNQAWNTAANAGNAGLPQLNAATAGYAGVLGQAAPQMKATQAAIAPWMTAAQAAAAPNTVAAQGQLAPNTVAAQAAAAQQAAASRDVTASQAKLSTLGGMNLNPYLSPYTQDVINKTLPLMQQQLAQQQAGIQNQANQANAFGGSRQAINQGVLGAQGAMGMGQMAAQLNQANYAQAQAAGEFDVGAANQMGEFNAGELNKVGMSNQQQANLVNEFNAQQGNQVNVANAGMMNTVNMNNQTLADAMAQFNAGQANTVGMNNQQQNNAMSQFNAGQTNNMGQFNTTQLNAMNQFNAGAQNTAANQNLQAQLAAMGYDLNAAAGLNQVGVNMGQQAQNAFNMQNTAGSEQMAQAQAAINANQQKFNQAYNYPTQQMGILESALGMTPYGTSTSGTGQTQTQTPFDWGALAAAGLGAAGNVFAGHPPSDKRLKKNLQKVAVHTPTKTPIYAYNWKGEPPGAPKHLGPMAQDLAKTIPGSVARHPTTGVLHVHPQVLGALARPAPAGTIGAMAAGKMPTRHDRPRVRMHPPRIKGALVG